MLGGGLRFREMLVEELLEKLVSCIVRGQEVVADPVVPAGVDSQSISSIARKDRIICDRRDVDAPPKEEVSEHQESADLAGTRFGLGLDPCMPVGCDGNQALSTERASSVLYIKLHADQP